MITRHLKAPFALATLAAAIAHGAVTSFEVLAYSVVGKSRAGDVVRVEGKVHGELELRNDIGIAGLDRAPRNAEGNVEYSARVVLVAPNQMSKSDGTLVVDLSDPGTLDAGDEFLQQSGFIVARIDRKGAELPSFVDAVGTKHSVEGVAYAIVRDTVDYLHWGMLDSKQKPNPLRGGVQRVIAIGGSEGGQFLRSFLVRGFNDAGGRRVFDGLAIFGSGAAQDPRSYAGLVANIPPANEALPKLMFINSVAGCVAAASSTARIPANVRVYDLAAAAHAARSRALLLKLASWASDDVRPPPSEVCPAGGAPAKRPPASR